MTKIMNPKQDSIHCVRLFDIANVFMKIGENSKTLLHTLLISQLSQYLALSTTLMKLNMVTIMIVLVFV